MPLSNHRRLIFISWTIRRNFQWNSNQDQKFLLWKYICIYWLHTIAMLLRLQCVKNTYSWRKETHTSPFSMLLPHALWLITYWVNLQVKLHHYESRFLFCRILFIIKFEQNRILYSQYCYQIYTCKRPMRLFSSIKLSCTMVPKYNIAFIRNGSMRIYSRREPKIPLFIHTYIYI